jgi:hypothetical protein
MRVRWPQRLSCGRVYSMGSGHVPRVAGVKEICGRGGRDAIGAGYRVMINYVVGLGSRCRLFLFTMA